MTTIMESAEHKALFIKEAQAPAPTVPAPEPTGDRHPGAVAMPKDQSASEQLVNLVIATKDGAAQTSKPPTAEDKLAVAVYNRGSAMENEMPQLNNMGKQKGIALVALKDFNLSLQKYKGTTASEILSDLVKIADYLGDAGFITSEAITDNLINSIIVEAKTKAKKVKKEMKKAKKAAKKAKKAEKLEEKAEKKEEKADLCPKDDPNCEM